jgi:hypothetical protein
MNLMAAILTRAETSSEEQERRPRRAGPCGDKGAGVAASVPAMFARPVFAAAVTCRRADRAYAGENCLQCTLPVPRHSSSSSPRTAPPIPQACGRAGRRLVPALSIIIQIYEEIITNNNISIIYQTRSSGAPCCSVSQPQAPPFNDVTPAQDTIVMGD